MPLSAEKYKFMTDKKKFSHWESYGAFLTLMSSQLMAIFGVFGICHSAENLIENGNVVPFGSSLGLLVAGVSLGMFWANTVDKANKK